VVGQRSVGASNTFRARSVNTIIRAFLMASNLVNNYATYIWLLILAGDSGEKETAGWIA
jgi:hypothetical protein